MLKLVALLLLPGLAAAQQIRLAGDWAVTVTAPDGTPATLTIAPAEIVTAVHERYESLPEFNPKAAPWTKGARLTGVVAEECTVQGALDPESLVVRAGPSNDARVFVKGVDYEADLAAGTLGRLAGGAIASGQPVAVTYRFAKQRIDSIVRSANGRIVLKQGTSHTVVPEMPRLAPGEVRLANVYLSGRLDRLSEDNLFPILEERFPGVATTTSFLPKTLAKLRSGATLRILAWGDSVTTYNRYQSMFVEGLRQRFPRAHIELATEAWGGRNTGSYLKEPPGSAHNYQEKVLAVRPDLIVSEFVNDAGLNEAQVEERYSKLLADFQGIGAEWIILSPHYVRPDWMKLTRQRDIDEDPRAYVKGIRRFAETHKVALADAAARYGRLWRQGIPYLTLMENNINHPNLLGHSIFAESLLALFPPGPAADAAAAADLRRTWQGIPGIERTANGRIFISWFSGGPREPAIENTVYFAYSDDDGQRYTTPMPLAGPRGTSRAFDPTLWIDPQRRLWYIFNRGDREQAAHGVYARICEKPDAPTPVFGPEFRIGFDEVPFSFRMNKPTVLTTGEWLMPVTHAAEPSHEWFARPHHWQGVAISTNQGKTWKLHGAVEAPDFALENMIVELRDKRLWMLIRTGAGALWESYSRDRGRTWSEGKATAIASPGSRFFIRRMASGNLLLVNHYKFKGRSHLTAQLSTNDGASWNEGLLLDERAGTSYPDGVQSADGVIRVIYDRDRQGAGELLMASFREDDVRAGHDVTGKVRLRQPLQRLQPQTGRKLLPPDWDPKAAGDRVMKSMIQTTGEEVKGAHDADMVLVGDRAFVVTMANDRQPGENAEWPFIYVTLSLVNLKTKTVERRIPVARGGQAFANETLPEGACFVPRILRKDARTLRVFFASEAPRQRQSRTYYRDFHLDRLEFAPEIHRAKIDTEAGVFDLQPDHFYRDAQRFGFEREAKDFGVYMIDSFKVFDGKTYAVVNNYPIGQNTWSILNEAKDTFLVLGHFNQPATWKLTEAAVNRLPDGTWLAICRQEAGSRNYTFSTSREGRMWSMNEYRAFVPNGTNSKPLFEKFWGVYYLGWQESTRINGVARSVFNIDVSVDGIQWERKYRFESAESFQYPGLREHQGSIYVWATQGNKERIMFGRLE